MNMSQRRATMLLLDKIEELRAMPFNEVEKGTHQEVREPYRLEWVAKDNTPYPGTTQFQVRVKLPESVIAESIFYRSE